MIFDLGFYSGVPFCFAFDGFVLSMDFTLVAWAITRFFIILLILLIILEYQFFFFFLSFLLSISGGFLFWVDQCIILISERVLNFAFFFFFFTMGIICTKAICTYRCGQIGQLQLDEFSSKRVPTKGINPVISSGIYIDYLFIWLIFFIY